MSRAVYSQLCSFLTLKVTSPLQNAIKPLRYRMGRCLLHTKTRSRICIPKKGAHSLLPYTARFLSAPVDQALHKFIENEIEAEKMNASKRKLPETISGFRIQTEGPLVTMTKKSKYDSVSVEFNINEMDFGYSMEDAQAQEKQESTGKPPFTVKITNSNNIVLSVNCMFPQSDAIEDESESRASDDDLFEIMDIEIIKGEGDKPSYAHQSAFMDGELYEILMDMLDERGIDNNFIEAMNEFATNYEQNQYIDFLTHLKTFTLQT